MADRQTGGGVKVRQAGDFKVLDFPPVEDDWDFWPMWENGGWEPDTRRVIAEHAAGKTYVDIGAWVGPTVLWAADAGAFSIRAFEPDPVARGILEANVRLNGLAVDIRPQAVAAAAGLLTLSVEDFAGSTSGVYGDPRATDLHDIKVPSVSVEDACYGAGFVKVDIEGAELDLIPALVEVGCPMLISIHPYHWNDTEKARFGRSLDLWSSYTEIVDGDLLCLP